MIGTLFSALLLVNTAHAGNPCAGVKVEADKFTQKQTSSVLLYAASYTVAEIRFNEGASELKLEFGASGLHQQALPAGTTVQLLLKDGSIVELASSAEAPPVPTSKYGGVGTYWEVRYALDKTTLSALSGQALTAIRTTLPSGEVTRDAFKGQVKKLQKGAACYASLVAD